MNKENRKAYNKKYRDEHKEQTRIRNREWYAANREYAKEYAKTWRTENKEYTKDKNKQYQKTKQQKRNENLDTWKDFLGDNLTCEICGEEVFLNNGTDKSTICFDHRNGGSATIKGKPSTWLWDNKRTKENEEIWKECDFGILCNKCNPFLPTKNRIEFLENVIKYMKQGEG